MIIVVVYIENSFQILLNGAFRLVSSCEPASDDADIHTGGFAATIVLTILEIGSSIALAISWRRMISPPILLLGTLVPLRGALWV